MLGNKEYPAAVGRKCRSWALEEKRRIVDESLADGPSIAEIARRYYLKTNQLFTWRRQFGALPVTRKELAPIVPVTITPDATAAYSGPGSTGQMEIALAEEGRIIVGSDVETAALSRVVKALRQ